MARKPKNTTRTAQHRPALRKRRFKHDDDTALELFSGFGGLTKGIELAGFTTILAANHNEYKVDVHEANFPEVEHWIADLVDSDAADYHSAIDLPAADLLSAGVSCTNHSQANTEKAYAQPQSLFDLDDPDFDSRVTRSERDRATANCVLHYAAHHHPRLIFVECTTELQSWGPAIQGRPKVGDGSTYRWWLKQFENLGYRYKVLFLNSMFFGVPQSRDRLYIAFWDRSVPTPDLDHRPDAWCSFCDETVPAVWTWKTGVPPTGSVRYGKQYSYRCPACHGLVLPPVTPSLYAMDLTDLGTKLGDFPIKEFTDKKTGEVFRGTHAKATVARQERCRERFPEFPAVLMPAKAVHGVEKHPWQPLSTQTSQQETAILSTGALLGAAGNTFERPGSDCRTRTFAEPLFSQTATNALGVVTPPIALALDNFQGTPRGPHEALPTQCGSETIAVLSSGVIPYRQNTLPAVHDEAMPTVTAEQIPALLTAAGTVKCNGSVEEAKYRAHPVSNPLGTVVGSAITQGMLFSGWYKQNGSRGDETAPHPISDPFGTLTSRDTTALLMAEWRAALADLPLEGCYFRMMASREIGRGCGFDVDFGDYKGSFVVWGSARDQVDGFGNAVSPSVGEWAGLRLRAALHGAVSA